MKPSIMRAWLSHNRPALWRLRKQNRRQPLAPVDSGLVVRAPRFKELHQLLAGPVIIPLAVALDDFQELLGGLAAVSGGVERGCEIGTRLMVERIRGDFLFQLGDRADRAGLFGEVDRSLHGPDRRV